ncbi:hypothetical protein Mapa_004655 [Marchantia paleacea]|nr:hypothetical protein Mapa_004655 [Marchantia paleacea]
MMTNSRFIVTGRNSQILKQIGREIHICSVPLLTDEEARRLFTALAFHPKEEPPNKFNEIVEELVRGCDGLPLAVTVVGKYLHGQDPNSKMELWKDVSEALKYVVDVDRLQKEIWKKLESSYEDLGEKEQKMFLDVATFMTFSNCPFTAQDSIKAWNALHHCANMRLQNLQARSLIRDVPTEHGGRFEMHGHLRRIGKSIAIKLGRICESTQIDPDFWLGDYYPSDDEITKEETPLMKVVAHRVKIIQEQSCTSDEDCCSCKIKRVFKRLSTVKFL